LKKSYQKEEMVKGENLDKITVNRGEKFELVVDNHPGGYRWFTHLTNNHIKKIGENYLRSNEVGSGGQTKFVFEGLKEGESVIKLISKRSWDIHSVSEITYYVIITSK